MPRIRPACLALCSVLSLAASPAQASVVGNGSFENPLGTWTDTSCGYMAVSPGGTAISGWTVSSGASAAMVWARSTTCDGYSAADGSFFVDLSGFGASAGAAATLDQTLGSLVAGATYTLTLQYLGVAPELLVDGAALSAVGGPSSGWSGLSTSFVAGGSSALLSLKNVAGATVLFVDDLRISGPVAGTPSGVPLPSSVALAGLGLALLAAGSCRS